MTTSEISGLILSKKEGNQLGLQEHESLILLPEPTIKHLNKTVKKGLKIANFNIYNMQNRVTKVGDLLKGVLGKGINMKQILIQLKQLL